MGAGSSSGEASTSRGEAGRPSTLPSASGSLRSTVEDAVLRKPETGEPKRPVRASAAYPPQRLQVKAAHKHEPTTSDLPTREMPITTMVMLARRRASGREQAVTAQRKVRGCSTLTLARVQPVGAKRSGV